MKIVQLIYSLSSGGAERFVVDICNELARKGHEVHLVTFRDGPGSDFYTFLLRDDVHCHNMAIKEGFSFGRVLKVMAALDRISPDVVHAHLNVIPYLYLLALLRMRVKFLHTLHSVANHTVGGRFQAVVNWLFYRLNIIQPVAISRLCNDSYKEFYGLRDAVVINNGPSAVLASEGIEGVRSEIASYLGGASKPVFVHVARHHPSKNQELLVSAFNQLNDQGVEFLLIIIGGGYDSENALGLRSRACESIKFLGERRNVGDYLLVSDAFCLSSRYEGLPISLLEALSAGCVPICTAVGGIPDVISDGATGYLSDGQDMNSYCRAIRRYLEDSGAIGSEALRNHYKKHYSIEKCTEAYLSIYKKL